MAVDPEASLPTESTEPRDRARGQSDVRLPKDQVQYVRLQNERYPEFQKSFSGLVRTSCSALSVSLFVLAA